MKHLSLLLLILIGTLSCSSQQKLNWDSVSVEYSAHSRGFYQEIEIHDQSARVTTSRNQKPIKIPIDKTSWNALKKEVEAISLEELHNFKAPTQKRFYDGAPIGNLTINYQDKEYQTSGFDHGYPPKEIEKLVTLIINTTNTTELNSAE